MIAKKKVVVSLLFLISGVMLFLLGALLVCPESELDRIARLVHGKDYDEILEILGDPVIEIPRNRRAQSIYVVEFDLAAKRLDIIMKNGRASELYWKSR